MKRREMRIRVYETQVDDSGTMLWMAEAGEPTGIGDGWVILAATRASFRTRQAALEDLGGMLWRRCHQYDAAAIAWSNFVLAEDPLREWRALAKKIAGLFRRRRRP